MSKWVVLDKSLISSDMTKDVIPVNMENGQSILRVTESNERYLTSFKKYEKAEIQLLDKETNRKHKSLVQDQFKTSPFASKYLDDGRKLYEVSKGYSIDIIEGVGLIDIEAEFDFKLIELDILNANLSDKLDFIVLDSEKNPIFQHADKIFLPDGRYKRHGDYEGEVKKGYFLRIIYYSNVQPTNTIYFNIPFHMAV